MKVLFMGTPDFAVSILEAIINSNHEVVGVVTQEDKPKGRSDKLMPPPVKECAMKHGLSIFQPHRIKDEAAIEELRSYNADIFVVSAFGQILSKEILDMPKYGCINTHASLLPKYRGAAPIQWSIVDGEPETGVTIMQMDEGVDTGDILFVSKVDITNEDTGESLFDKLADAGAKIIVESLDKIEAGDVTRVKQDESLATHAKMLNKRMGQLDFSKSAVQIERLIRGFTPWPGTYTYLNGKILKIIKAYVKTSEEVATITGLDTIELEEKSGGAIVYADKRGMFVATGDGFLDIVEVQLEGKKRMLTTDFLKGYKVNAGEILG